MTRECICEIRSIYRKIGAFEQSLHDEFGLNINETMLLCVVADRKHITSGEIAEEMNMTNSNTSKVISTLEKKKLICRHACREDLRCMRFSITKKGEEMLAAMNCSDIELPDIFKEP